MLGTTVYLRYNSRAKYVNLFSFFFCALVVQIMLEYICLFFNSDNNLYKVLGELRF